MKTTLIIAVISLTILVGFKTGYLGSVDIYYDFESIEIDSGPDTFELFEQSTSEVSLSSAFAFRGAYSLHIQDYVKNSDFPEFQGYFPPVSSGTIEVGFALMTPTPEEPFNIAFAGKKHFSMVKDGIGFWLFNKSGTLRHMSDSIPKKLLELTPFQWYWFEITLDIDKGEYSLKVSDEFDNEIISLEKQKHPINATGSSLQKYSFIGDLEDQGNGDLYIDEFIFRTDYAESPKPLIAPGRRSLFIDQWNEYHKKLENIDFCLAPKLPYDFINIYNTLGLETLKANTDDLRILLSTPSQETLDQFSHEDEFINGISMWAKGCLSIKLGQYQQAIQQLDTAESMTGTSPATQMALAIAYAKTNQQYQANAVVSKGLQKWPEDARWAILSAAIGFIFDKSQNSEAALSQIANSLKINKESAKTLMGNYGWLTQPALDILNLNKVWDEKKESLIIAEQYYFSLLWQERYNDAEKYANNFNHLLKQHKITSPLWLERAGNAALFAKDYSNAERKYKSALKAQKNRSSSLPKLADVYFLENRVEEEREVRESIYGVLNYE